MGGVDWTRRRIEAMPDAAKTSVKWVFVAIDFGIAISTVVWGALYISFGKPWVKVGGLGLLLVGVVLWAVGLWVATGRPRHWFAPGENTDFDPRR